MLVNTTQYFAQKTWNCQQQLQYSKLASHFIRLITMQNIFLCLFKKNNNNSSLIQQIMSKNSPSLWLILVCNILISVNDVYSNILVNKCTCKPFKPDATNVSPTGEQIHRPVCSVKGFAFSSFCKPDQLNRWVSSFMSKDKGKPDSS